MSVKKRAQLEGSASGDGYKTHTITSQPIVPDTYRVHVTAPPPSQFHIGTPSPPGPESKAFWEIRNRCASCPWSLIAQKHTLFFTHTLEAIQNRHRDPVGLTGQRDPELDPSPQHLRQEGDAIGFSCDPPAPLCCLGLPFSLRQTVF